MACKPPRYLATPHKLILSRTEVSYIPNRKSPSYACDSRLTTAPDLPTKKSRSQPVLARCTCWIYIWA